MEKNMEVLLKELIEEIRTNNKKMDLIIKEIIKWKDLDKDYHNRQLSILEVGSCRDI